MAQQTQTRALSVTDTLNKQVANMGLLYVKLHNYHWYVKGEGFYTLHAKFQELYDEIAKHYDDLAERLLSLGGRPVGTMAETLKLSTLQEASGSEEAGTMVGQLIQDFTTVANEMKEGIAAADSAGDQPTADMLTSIRNSLEKHCWMLRAYLGKS